jgi:hypothetical protein
VPKLYTTYLARWGKISSVPIIAQVSPKVTLRPGGNGYMRVQVTGPRAFWHRHVFLQRLSRFGQDGLGKFLDFGDVEFVSARDKFVFKRSRERWEGKRDEGCEKRGLEVWPRCHDRRIAHGQRWARRRRAT